jgi:hypothetical protein
MRLKKKPIQILIFAVLATTAFTLLKGPATDLVSKISGNGGISQVPKSANLPLVTLTNGNGTDINLQNMSDRAFNSSSAIPIRMNVWAWNAQMGLMLANGGPKTTVGSLMSNNNISLDLIRQDDSSKMQEALLAFATELKAGNPNPTKGVHFVSIMGDGSASFLKGLNDQLIRLGKEYRAVVIGSCGYSRGEDKFMGPPSWRANPVKSKGGVVAGYLRDGDWNIAQKWLGDNNLKNNPDETTYDPNALNWVAASDYLDAVEKYVTNYSESRDEVIDGKRTGKKVKISVDGVVTWTPGDVNVAKKKGGIISIVSTREYASQMPNVIIGISKWVNDNKKTTINFLDSIFTAGDAIKSSEAALDKASETNIHFFKFNAISDGSLRSV